MRDNISRKCGDPSSTSRGWEKANKKRTKKARRQSDKKIIERY